MKLLPPYYFKHLMSIISSLAKWRPVLFRRFSIDQYKTWTADCGLGIKYGLRTEHKTRTRKKGGLRTEYKTRTRYKMRTTD